MTTTRVARGAARSLMQAVREAAAKGPGGRGAAARPRVLVVSAERRSRTSGSPVSGARQGGRQGTRSVSDSHFSRLVEASLASQGAQVLRFTLPAAVAAGVEPQASSVAAGVATLRRTGADVVIGHGNSAVLSVAAALAAVSGSKPRDDAALAAFFSIVEDGRLVSARSKKPQDIDSAMALPWVALPTLPSGGAEVSSIVALEDYDRERRLVRNFATAPEWVLADPEAIEKDLGDEDVNERKDILDARVIHFLLGRELELALQPEAMRNQNESKRTVQDLTYLVDAAEAQEQRDASKVAEILFPESIAMGNQSRGLLPVAPHEIMAAALRDIMPVDFDLTCGSLLAGSLKMLSEEQNSTETAKAVREVLAKLPSCKGLLEQGIIFDKEKHLRAASQVVDGATRGKLRLEKVLQVYEEAL